MTHCGCVWKGQEEGPPFSECHYHASRRADYDALIRENEALHDVHDLLLAARAEVSQLRAVVAALRGLLRSLSEWDMMDSAADSPYWRKQIDAALKGGITDVLDLRDKWLAAEAERDAKDKQLTSCYERMVRAEVRVSALGDTLIEIYNCYDKGGNLSEEAYVAIDAARAALDATD